MLTFPSIHTTCPATNAHDARVNCSTACCFVLGSQALTIGGRPNSAKIYGIKIHGLAVHYDW